jgi:hypothetical protein
MPFYCGIFLTSLVPAAVQKRVDFGSCACGFWSCQSSRLTLLFAYFS